MVKIHVLDYGAGNVASLNNALSLLGYETVKISNAQDFEDAEFVLFPGVGAFGNAVECLVKMGVFDALKEYVLADKPFLGICIGMQVLFEGSEESPDVSGLGVIPGKVCKLSPGVKGLSVPHMGWNSLIVTSSNNNEKKIVQTSSDSPQQMYFVHSFAAVETEQNKDWTLTSSSHGSEFISSIRKGNVTACQFHPEKSGASGLSFIDNVIKCKDLFPHLSPPLKCLPHLSKRIIACLDVRSTDEGDLVVTKGDQYDVRVDSGTVRNMGKPVELAKRYFDEGADELAFLNITSFRSSPLGDAPLLELLRQVSTQVFVPLTIGGGIRSYTDSQGVEWSALEVASAYFRAGADKVSLGSDAVYASEQYYQDNRRLSGSSAIETIAQVYGRQAVVVSIDPKRVYLAQDETSIHRVFSDDNGERWWYQCTVSGGREARDIDAVEVAIACEALGAGEILLNSIDQDGQGNGFDHDLIAAVKNSVSIPVIASSGAGNVLHFQQVFEKTNCDAALAAGIFHRKQVSIAEVKNQLSR